MRTDKIAILIKRKALVIDKFAGQRLSEFELTNTQYKIIKFLYGHADNAVRQADIEERFSLTNPTVTGIINNLEKKGLVQRVRNPEDRRSRLLVLTDTAWSLKEELYRVGEDIEAFVSNSLTEAECDELVRLLNKIKDK